MINRKQEMNKDGEDVLVSRTKKRRHMLKSGVLAGGVLAGTATLSNWQKPVVESVLLPLHASTTNVDGDSGEGERDASPSYFRELLNLSTTMFPHNVYKGLVARALDSFMQVASAGLPRSFRATVCIQDANESYRVVYTEESPDRGTVTVWTGTGSLGDAIDLVQEFCPEASQRDLQIQLTSQTKNSISMQFVGESIPGNARDGGYDGVVVVNAGSCEMLSTQCLTTPPP